MIDKEKLMKEFYEKFSLAKEKIGFSVSLDELEEEFSIKDVVYEMGYVRENIEMQIASRMVDYFRNWGGFLTGILTPSSSYVHQVESKLFNNEEDKKEIWEIIKICMKFSAMFSAMFLSKDKEMQKDFFDLAYDSWKKKVSPKVTDIMKKISNAWGKE